MKKKCLGRVTKTEKTEKTPTTTSTSTKEKVSIWFSVFYFIFFISFSLPNSVSLPLDHKIYVDLLWAVVSLFDFGFFCLFSWLFVFD